MCIPKPDHFPYFDSFPFWALTVAVFILGTGLEAAKDITTTKSNVIIIKIKTIECFKFFNILF